MFDAFVSYASEEKDCIVVPLVERLSRESLRIWYDDHRLIIGDSVVSAIDAGLDKARYGVVILSIAYFTKKWPRYELDQLSKTKMDKILPILHGITHDDVERHAPCLSSRRALSTDVGLGRICSEIIQAIR